MKRHCRALAHGASRRRRYRTHAIGKYDIGFAKKECSATFRGFDSFYGYYCACQADYWHHGASGGYPGSCPRAFDLANNSGADTIDAHYVDPHNGTYNRQLFSDEAVRLINAHDPATSFYLYLAFMNVHDGCESANQVGPPKEGKQAPLETVQQHYATTLLDTYKLSGAMYTELDTGVRDVVAALQQRGMWEHTLFVFSSDNGGPLDHCTNAPLRGGKHTFWEGGVRLTAFVSGPLVPAALRGTEFPGLAHAADWYATLFQGLAGGTLPASTGTRPPDSVDLWAAITTGGPSPRTEVVLQVENQYFSEGVSAIRVGHMKLIRAPGKNGPGDCRTVAWPEPGADVVPLGRSGGFVWPNGSNHAYAPSHPGFNGSMICDPYCLFNVTEDIGERRDLQGVPGYHGLGESLLSRLAQHGATGPRPAYIWDNRSEWQQAVGVICEQAGDWGVLQPVDAAP